MVGKPLHRIPLWGRYIFCLCLSFALCGFVLLFFPHFTSLHTGSKAPLLFEKPNFQMPAPEDPEEEPQANQGYRIEHTPRGLIRFRTETAGSPAFGTPVPEILPYDPRTKLVH